MAKKQFRVEINTKGSFEIEVAAVDSKEYNVDEISADDFEEILQDGEYIVNCGLGDEWCGTFEMTVSDENGDVVFESENFSDFRFVVESDVTEDEDFPTTVDPKNATTVWENRWAEDGNGQEPGIYAVRRHEIKWLSLNFVVEDEKFDPSKLMFVSNRKLRGLFYDYMTDPGYVFYGDKFVNVDFDEEYEEYGYDDCIMEKTEDGWWEEY